MEHVTPKRCWLAVIALAVIASCSKRQDEPSARGAPPGATTSAASAVPASTTDTLDPRLCQQRAALIVNRVGATDPRALVEARSDLECACRGGIAESCTAVGLSYSPDVGPQDHERANPWLEKGCTLGDAWGCTNYATSLSKGRGVKQDYAASNRLNRRACDLGDKIGCANAAAQIIGGRLGPPDKAAAKALFERGCALGDAQSCAGVQQLSQP